MIPDRVKIGAAWWEVIVTEGLLEEEDNVQGLTTVNKNLIEIRTGMAEAEEEAVFIHELLHACCHFAGIDYGVKMQEEDFVNRVAPVLHMVLRDNPELSRLP